MQNNSSNYGFTLVEVLIVAPILILLIGTFIGLVVANTGESLDLRQSSSNAYDTQAALDSIESDIRRSSSYLTQTTYASAPQGKSDDDTQFTNAVENGFDTLILSSPSTTHSPFDQNRTLIYKGSGGCNPLNPISTYNTVYFVRNEASSNVKTLYKRTIIDPSPSCAQAWQRPSCSEQAFDSNSHPSKCKSRDEKLVSNIKTFDVKYFSGILQDATTEIPDSQANSAASAKVFITTTQTIAGSTRDITSSVSSSSVNGSANSFSNDQTVPNPELTFSRDQNSPYTSNFSWEPIGNASGYDVTYRVNNGSWQNGPQNTTLTNYSYTLTGRKESVEVRVVARVAGGSYSYGSKTSTIPDWHECTYTGAWRNYDAAQSTYSAAKFTRSSANVIMLQGLVAGGTAGNGSAICVLPPEFRPSHRLIFQASTAGTTVGRIDVNTDGTIIAMNGSSTWLNLGSISFMKGGAVSWTNLSSANGWTNYGSVFSDVSATKDTIGRAHLQGLAKDGTSSPAGTIAYYLPANYQPTLPDIYGAMGGGAAYSALQINQAGTTTTRNTGASNAYWSIQAMFYPSSISGWQNASLTNGWVTYTSSYSTPGYIKSSDGIVSLRGMMKSGTVANGTVAFTLPAGYRPSEAVICDVSSNNSYTRLDVATSGNVIIREGASNTWLSLAGCDFMGDQ